MPKYLKIIVIFLTLTILHVGNASSELIDNYIETDNFKIFTKHRITSSGTINIYIEGDGNAWETKYKLSKDPTPKNPESLYFAKSDTNNNVVYIARPCQYLNSEDLGRCKSKYWSTARYSEEVIESINKVISFYTEKYKSTGINVIGFSGGGTIASLLPFYRNDIKSITTVSANLDHKALRFKTNTTPLYKSLNPQDFTKKYPKIPQHHIVGEKDKLIDESIIFAFSLYQPHPECIKISTVSNQGHSRWQDIWTKLSSPPLPEC